MSWCDRDGYPEFFDSRRQQLKKLLDSLRAARIGGREAETEEERTELVGVSMEGERRTHKLWLPEGSRDLSSLQGQVSQIPCGTP